MHSIIFLYLASKKAKKEACKRAKKASKVQTAANRSVSMTIRTRKQTQLIEQVGREGVENSHNGEFEQIAGHYSV